MSTASDIFKADNGSSDSDLEADEEIAVTESSENNKTCKDSEFKSIYKIFYEKAISLKKEYILKTTADSSFKKLVAGTSNGTVQIFDINSADTQSTGNFNFQEKGPICGVKFLDETSNSLLIGNLNGEVNLIDLRSNEKCHTFEDKATGENRKTITCFDINSNGRLLCTGTEQIFNDAYLIFYDIREKKLLGSYWESHQDDITDIKFHPTKQDLLITGSTDGLINIFAVSQEDEDEALQETINTESSVQKLNWHKNVYEKDFISCITHTNDLKLFNTEGDLLAMFDRDSIANKVPGLDRLNLISCHNSHDDSIFALTGCNLNRGAILKSLTIQNKELLPCGTFKGNRQIIRDSLFNIEKNILITVGESGIITLWSTKGDNFNDENLKLKIKSNEKIHKRKPY